MGNFYTGNRFLTATEMFVNGDYVCDYLSARGWSLNAICGMLGNMQVESTVNPGIWQNLDEGNTAVGYGLVQWTPASKYLNWCASNGLDPTHMDTALDRLEYERKNGLQYYKTTAYNLTFTQFKTSKESPEYLAQAFMRNYERPANQNTTVRGTNALMWWERLNGGAWQGSSAGSKPKRQTTKMSLILMALATKKR